MSRFVRVSKAVPPGFVNVHPRPGRKTRLSKGPDLPPSGGVDGVESKYIRCKQCGFVNNLQVNHVGSGWGNEQVIESLYDDDKEYDNGPYESTITNIIVGGGCALCGSSEFV